MNGDTREPYGRKIFVASSTADLIDIRAELYAYLHELGLMPIMYEHSFERPTEKNGNGVGGGCDQNVEGADAIVIILSERYGGPRIKDSSKQDTSTKPCFEPSYTHFEYWVARWAGKPVHFYARTFLVEAYQQWAKTVPADIREKLRIAQTTWKNRENQSSFEGPPSGVLDLLAKVPAVKDPIEVPGKPTVESSELEGLYRFILSQEYWVKQGDVGLITPFNTIVDLKEHIRIDLRANRLMANYEDLLRAGKLPFIRVTHATPYPEYAAGHECLRLTNVAPTPAAFDSASGVYYVAQSQLDGTESLYLDSQSHKIYLEGKGGIGGGTEKDGTPQASRVAHKVEGGDWSPAEPSVLRDGDERVVRVCVQDMTDPAKGFVLWVVYQSVLGEPLHMADQYAIRRIGKSTWSIFCEGKYVVLPTKQRGAVERGISRTMSDDGR